MLNKTLPVNGNAIVVPFINCTKAKGKTLGGLRPPDPPLGAVPAAQRLKVKGKTLGSAQTHQENDFPGPSIVKTSSIEQL